jgi:PhzF family phenazine biosynthesis protein
MKQIKMYVVDAFTDKPFLGNPAGVVLDADELTAEEMQMVAKEINLSETAFIRKSDKPGVHYRVRYFTPSLEIDFCGHATIASSWVIFSTGLVHIDGPLVLETNIGIIPIVAFVNEHVLNQVVMTQVKPQLNPVHDSVETLCKMTGLNIDDYDTRYSMELAYTGNWHLLIPVRTKEAIDKAAPDFDALAKHNRSQKISTTHLFTFDIEKPYLVYTRDFAPSSGVLEDPVTGSANGALAGYLALSGIISQNEYHILQGNSRKRPGEVFIRVCRDDGIRVQVGGKAVIIINGFLNIK